MEKVLDSFIRDGICRLGNFKNDFAEKTYEAAKSKIRFESIFLNEQQTNTYKSNPMPGRNLAEEMQLYEFFGDEDINRIFRMVAGERYRILDYKFVIGFPRNLMPDWVFNKTDGRVIANLGEYLKTQSRNCTYFSGIDYHQDILDHPNRHPDFVTIYYYLSEVSKKESPLLALTESQKIGPDIFPHELYLRDNEIIHTATNKVVYPKLLTGKPGDMFCWHPYTLHGTYPTFEGEPRISLRILLERNSDVDINSWICKINREIDNTKPIPKTRIDESKDKSFIWDNMEYLKNNSVALN